MNPQLIYDIAEQVHLRAQAGRDTIRLNIGEPDGSPPEAAGNAVHAALQAGKTKYGSSYGEPELRSELARIHGVKPEQIIIGPGSKMLLYGLLHYFLTSPDDEVLLPVPSWGAFPLMVNDLGKGRIRPVPMTQEGGWHLPENIETHVNAHTKLMVLVNPNNPTSTVQREEAVAQLHAIARKRNITLIIDEAYHALRFTPVPERESDVTHAVRVRTFSKPFRMTGFRIGYAVAREEIVEALAKFFQITITCVPPFIQHAVLRLMADEQGFTQGLREQYQKRLALAESILKPAGVTYAPPDAAFYIFAKLPVADAALFAKKLLDEQGVAVVPGAAFGPYPQFIRISLTETDERLAHGLTAVVTALQSYD